MSVNLLIGPGDRQASDWQGFAQIGGVVFKRFAMHPPGQHCFAACNDQLGNAASRPASDGSPSLQSGSSRARPTPSRGALSAGRGGRSSFRFAFFRIAIDCAAITTHKRGSPTCVNPSFSSCLQRFRWPVACSRTPQQPVPASVPFPVRRSGPFRKTTWLNRRWLAALWVFWRAMPVLAADPAASVSEDEPKASGGVTAAGLLRSTAAGGVRPCSRRS